MSYNSTTGIYIKYYGLGSNVSLSSVISGGYDSMFDVILYWDDN